MNEPEKLHGGPPPSMDERYCATCGVLIPVREQQCKRTTTWFCGKHYPEAPAEPVEQTPRSFLAEHARVVAHLNDAIQAEKEASAARNAVWRARETMMNERDVLRAEVVAMQPVVDAAGQLHRLRFEGLDVTTKLAAVVVDRYRTYEQRERRCKVEPPTANIVMDEKGVAAAAEAGFFGGLHAAGFRLADTMVEEDPAIGVLQSELETATARIAELEAELTRERAYTQEAIDGIRKLGANGTLESFMKPAEPAEDSLPGITTQIRTGEVDHHGELELIMEVNGVEGSIYMSKEMWDAFAEKAGWKSVDDVEGA